MPTLKFSFSYLFFTPAFAVAGLTATAAVHYDMTIPETSIFSKIAIVPIVVFLHLTYGGYDNILPEHDNFRIRR